MSQTVSDFTEILGDSQVTIGDSLPLWTAHFDTTGRSSHYNGFLILNIRGLTYSTFDVDVTVNGQSIGKIYHYGGVSDAERDEVARHWFTQMIAISGATLKSGSNELQIQAVKNPAPTAADTFDDFSLKNVLCFFHKLV